MQCVDEVFCQHQNAAAVQNETLQSAIQTLLKLKGVLSSKFQTHRFFMAFLNSLGGVLGVSLA